MWTLLVLNTGAIRVATGPLRRLFPGVGVSLAGVGGQPPVGGQPRGQPWRIQLSGGSDPEGSDSAGGWCWQSHQVPPGQSS
jgi:hypothetical protein